MIGAISLHHHFDILVVKGMIIYLLPGIVISDDDYIMKDNDFLKLRNNVISSAFHWLCNLFLVSNARFQVLLQQSKLAL